MRSTSGYFMKSTEINFLDTALCRRRNLFIHLIIHQFMPSKSVLKTEVFLMKECRRYTAVYGRKETFAENNKLHLALSRKQYSHFQSNENRAVVLRS